MANNAIFISYRRDDSRDPAGRIHDRLVEEFGEDALFFDIETMPYGEDFRRHVVKVLGECRACLVVIGPRWLDIRNDKSERRLDDAEDLVRIEVETALKRKDDGVAVIPVLVSDAEPPGAEALPASLKALADLNAAVISSGRHFHHDVGSLINRLRKIDGLSAAPGSDTPAGRAWAKISGSVDLDDLQRFADSFPGTEEGLEARRRIDRLKKENAAWAAVNWESLASIDAFVQAWPQSQRIGEMAIRRMNLVKKQEAEAAARAAEEKRKADARAAKDVARAAEKAGKPDRNILGGVYFWVMFFVVAMVIAFLVEKVYAFLG